MQWLQSPEISGERVKLQYALRDPYRESHFNDEGYQSRPNIQKFCAKAPKRVSTT